MTTTSPDPGRMPGQAARAGGMPQVTAHAGPKKGLIRRKRQALDLPGPDRGTGIPEKESGNLPGMEADDGTSALFEDDGIPPEAGDRGPPPTNGNGDAPQAGIMPGMEATAGSSPPGFPMPGAAESGAAGKKGAVQAPVLSVKSLPREGNSREPEHSGTMPAPGPGRTTEAVPESPAAGIPDGVAPVAAVPGPGRDRTLQQEDDDLLEDGPGDIGPLPGGAGSPRPVPGVHTELPGAAAAPGIPIPHGGNTGLFATGRKDPAAAKPAGEKKPFFRLPVVFRRRKAVGNAGETRAFDVGPLGEPSLTGLIRDVDITYAVEAPFQYIRIWFDQDEGALVYAVLEPELSESEQEIFAVVERAFEKMISTNIDLIEGGRREEFLREKFLSIISIFGLPVTSVQVERIFFWMKKTYLGLGRIDALMKDKYIEDISCNGSGLFIYVQHRIYGSVRTNVRFQEVELNNFVLRLAQIGGRHISLIQPIRDVSLPDGSRANLTLGGEVTKKGSTFTIRKFRANPISPIEMMDYGTIDAQQLAYLWILMENKRSILVSGGTATGKTTLLNVLCAFIPTEYKIVSIEDTAELNLMHPNWLQSITRSGFGSADTGPAASGMSGPRKAPGDISLYDLLTAALRQRPEYIIVGEVRGDEAFTLFQAIAVGHAALGTIHAGSMNELLARVESNPMNVPRSLLANLDAVVFPMHIRKEERSLRRISNIVEILELDRDKGDLITATTYRWVPDKDVFRFQGRSFLFDKIRDTYGVAKDRLMTELSVRTRFLVWLSRCGIRDYGEVTFLVRKYYRNRDEVVRQMEDGADARAFFGSGDLLEDCPVEDPETFRDPGEPRTGGAQGTVTGDRGPGPYQVPEESDELLE